ncbi:endonuclease/exonuclease/phosphatase family protein [Catellatospora citrea]|uniref:Endonuclease n=1 Tax=Catellatospora citrea TaxID=53366 RepID=A0A8J3NZ57_9ACTN|nr:endonuclease/exonuclease/phosphatase family protein [Catellatospora citrea]RKE00465.1 endonuclease/exonuclease/phosphatase (EEP) superfamily protein YafD [Catellatospora citrea]GIF98125.1 endonuclease [Catellatospora citrea]
MTDTAVSAPQTPDRHDLGDRGSRRGRAARLVARLVLGVMLAVPLTLVIVRLTGLDAGTVLAVPIVLFPYSLALSVLGLGVMLAVAGLRSRWAVLAVALLMAAQVALLAPRFLPDQRQVPAQAPELRVATVNANVGAADPAALVALVQTERLDVLSVQQLPTAGIAALTAAGLDTLLPYHELRPEYDSSIYSRFPLSRGGPLSADTAWPQTTADVTVAGRTVRLVAVHTYYPVGDPDRWTRDMRALAGVARDSGPDTVFLGDFNATLDHTPMRDLLAAGLTDTHAELGRGWARTWPVGMALLPPLVQIDHVLHGSGLAGVSVGERTVPGTDHRAVVAVLALLPAE